MVLSAYTLTLPGAATPQQHCPTRCPGTSLDGRKNAHPQYIPIVFQSSPHYTSLIHQLFWITIEFPSIIPTVIHP